MQLVSKELISLEEKSMDCYFPEYKHPLWKKINVKYLMSHSLGIPDDSCYLTKEEKIPGNETLILKYLNWLIILILALGQNINILIQLIYFLKNQLKG